MAFIEKQPSPDIQNPHLERSVSLPEAVVYGLGIIVGAGIYALVGEAAGIAGNLVWVSFVLAAVIAAFTALSYCELSSLFPKCAAEYTYVKNAFNSNILGFMVGWVSLFGMLIGIAAVSLGFGGYFSGLFGVPVVLGAISLIALVSIVNFLGIQESAKINILLTGVAIAGLVMVIIMGVPFLGSVNYFEGPSQAAGLFELLNPVAIAAALIFFAYIGFEDLANLTEETVNATKSIPKAIIIALVVSTILYILVSVSVISIVPWQELSKSSAPISLVAERVLGPEASILFSFIALFATSSTVLILSIAASRFLYGLSEDRSLPRILSRIHSRTKTPYAAIAIASIATMLFVLSGRLKDVAFVTNFGVFVLFSMVNLSVIVLRFRKPGLERPFRVPGQIGKMPVIPLIGLLSSLFLLSRIEPNAMIFGATALLLGFPAYFLLKKIK